ncbi:MAG: ribosomal L7Ae/L30e/S12e/Gadd45 family protein [Nanoarchaeota archaeon]
MSATELKKDIKEGRLIFGTERTLKSLKNGKLEKVYIASNCKRDVKEDINYYAKLSGIMVVELETNNKETSVICKKPFNISVLGLLKEK